MQSMVITPTLSKHRLWAGRVLSGLVGLFLLFDGVMKLFKPAPVMEAFARLEIPEHSAIGIGLLLVLCTTLYVIPRTAVLGAVSLTGYLGGAVAIHVRSGDALFPVLFPVLLGLLLWAGLYLRESRLGQLVPLRRDPVS